MIEISVKVSNEEQTLTQKFLEYSEDIVLSENDPKIESMIQQTISKFKGIPSDVVFKAKMVCN